MHTGSDRVLPPVARASRAVALIAVFGGLACAQANLLVNGDAEAGTLAGWTDPLGNGFNISTTLAHDGMFSFTGGTTGPSGPHSNELRQDVDVTGLAAVIDGGAMTSRLRGFGRTNAAGGYSDPGNVRLEFLDGGAAVLASHDTGTFAPFNAWQSFADERIVPAGTRTLRVCLLGSRSVGLSTDCFFDDLELGVYE
jgi:hypothetical protein